MIRCKLITEFSSVGRIRKMRDAVLGPGFESVKHFSAQGGERREGEIGEGVFA